MTAHTIDLRCGHLAHPIIKHITLPSSHTCKAPSKSRSQSSSRSFFNADWVGFLQLHSNRPADVSLETVQASAEFGASHLPQFFNPLDLVTQASVAPPISILAAHTHLQNILSPLIPSQQLEGDPSSVSYSALMSPCKMLTVYSITPTARKRSQTRICQPSPGR